MVDKTRIYKIIFLIIIISFIISSLCWAENYPEDLWKGLIGEACGEGYTGMYAVACVYKNRLDKGMPLGCVALKRKDLDKFVNFQGLFFQKRAKDIIKKVFELNGKDITLGATHYENIERFGVPKWAKNMIITIKIGKHTFYKLGVKLVKARIIK